MDCEIGSVISDARLYASAHAYPMFVLRRTSSLSDACWPRGKESKVNLKINAVSAGVATEDPGFAFPVEAEIL